jgi:hypothetical protein
MPSEQSFATVGSCIDHLVRKMVLEDHDRIVAPRCLHLVALLVVRPLGVAGEPRVPVHRERNVALVPEPIPLREYSHPALHSPPIVQIQSMQTTTRMAWHGMAPARL